MQAEPTLNTILDFRFYSRGMLTPVQLRHRSRVAFLVAQGYDF